MREPGQGSKQRGAVLALFAASVMVMLLFCGLALDVGFLYISRAALAKGTDAAALMAVKSLGAGQEMAEDVAVSTFRMNYGGSGLPPQQVSDPTVTVTFAQGPNNITIVTVTTRVTYYTFLLGLLSEFDSLTVGATSQATREPLVMALALNRSDSMLSNSGATALPGAVGTFIDYFDDINDKVALTSYADHATVDVPMSTPFKALIRSEAAGLNFAGYTYAEGGIELAHQQIDSVPQVPGVNMVRALVLFTDGQANAFLENDVRCVAHIRRRLVLVPGNGAGGGIRDFRDPADGSEQMCPPGLNLLFYSRQYQTTVLRTAASVSAEGRFRAEQAAQAARMDGIMVLTVGLGSNINEDSLCKMANDPCSPIFNPAQPEGLAVFAPAASDLDAVFRQVAARILLRLSQ